MTDGMKGLKIVSRYRQWTVFTIALTLCGSAAAVQKQSDATPDDRSAVFQPVLDQYHYDRRVVMVPMRDGVRLKTIILVPKGSSAVPILLTRTPYDATNKTTRTDSPNMDAVLNRDGLGRVGGNGYIRVVQDVRGKYGSEGSYSLNPAPRGLLNHSGIDDTTDAWDTIDWLVKNVPETNGRVGMIGLSYDGWLVTMALLEPHPALKVAVPVNPMIDGWMGDDWFHYGAFRQVGMSYIYNQIATRDNSKRWAEGVYDEYDLFLKAGAAGTLGTAIGMDQLGFWKKLTEHPAYDDWWRSQAVDQLLAQKPLKVPTLWIQGLWDQEDIYGAFSAYKSVESKDTNNDLNFIVLGPWQHGQVNRDGSSLGAIRFGSDTALTFRRDYLQPFLDQYLKPGSPKAKMPPVLAFETGTNQWRSYDSWPPTAAANAGRSIYLQPEFGLGFDSPAGSGSDTFISDPSKPVPYRIRPDLADHQEGSTWRYWLVDDQRPFSDRTDVLTYVGKPLDKPVKVMGQPHVDLMAATTGTDCDWVVKLIDEYPEEVPDEVTLGGYQLPISMNIFRGRYREDLAKPAPLKANKPLEYKFDLPNVNHVFLPGHRIVVQIQSSWFPLYDRNPQSFVPNIFYAEPGAYQKATQRIYYGGAHGTRIDFPIVLTPTEP
jgi:putative CocE/NonD family hydrolase